MAILLQTTPGSDASKVSRILEHLSKGTMGHYIGFVRSLIASNQSSVAADILGEDVAKYKVNYKGKIKLIQFEKKIIDRH